MKRLGLFLLLGAVISALTGCGAGASVTPTGSAAGAVPPGAITVTPGPVSMTEFIASDQALVGKTGRPQLVEFFAFW